MKEKNSGIPAAVRLCLKWMIMWLLAVFITAGSFSAGGVTDVHAATVRINTSKKTLYAGKTFKLKIRGSKDTFYWSSSNKKVARVDKKTGLLTAVSGGEAVVTAKGESGTFECRVTVKEPQLNPERATMWIGESVKIKLKGATAVDYYCYSADDSKISVSGDGVVTALAECSSVGVYVRDSLDRLYVCTVVIKTPYIKPGDTVLEIGDSLQLKLIGAEAAEFFCNEIDDDKITVTGDGLVTAKAPGETIGVYAVDTAGNVYSCLITVNEPPEPTPELTPEPAREKEYYGLTYAHEKTDYIASKVYYDIATDDDFLNACKEALIRGMKEFEIYFTANDTDYWLNLYQQHMGMYSDLSSYGIVKAYFLQNRDGTGGHILFVPEYKTGVKAGFFLKYAGYEADTDTLKIYGAAYSIAAAASELYPGNVVAQLLYANNRICDITTYSKRVSTDSTASQFDATGVFFYGDAVCEGYTAAYRLILDMLGIENHVVVNTLDNHIWNRILLDGSWYHVDVTWNDKPEPNKNRFFMLSDAQLAMLDPANHSWIDTYLP
ncbi:MAG: Ig-like domain-containing protein [Lachnospiraceae bacterium]|nr:Ig-like domain-containing protein [Lachnospiraceae bacterium]